VSNAIKRSLFEELQLINDVSKIKPGTISKDLKEALEMEDDDVLPIIRICEYIVILLPYRADIFFN
jgi:hypothetical protein